MVTMMFMGIQWRTIIACHLVVCASQISVLLLMKFNRLVNCVLDIHTVEQFLFDRSKQQNIASFITEPDIKEDNEDVDEPSPSSNDEKYNLSELERAKLVSCLETIRNVIGDTVSDSKLKEKIILSNFDANTALDAILKESSPKKDIGMLITS